MEIVFTADEIVRVAGQFLIEWGDRKIVAFNGEMGAGKTTFIQAVCRALGVQDNMGSPTFSIINEYLFDKGSIYHIDLYRCRSEEEVIRAGVEECLYSGERCFVEWPSVAEGIFPEDTLMLNIEILDQRTRRLSGEGHQ